MRPASEEQLERVAAVVGDRDEASILLGRVQSIFDALEAIREGKPWRGMTEPREIARAALIGSVDADGEPI